MDKIKYEQKWTFKTGTIIVKPKVVKNMVKKNSKKHRQHSYPVFLLSRCGKRNDKQTHIIRVD